MALQTLVSWVANENTYQRRSWGPMGGGPWKATFRLEGTILELGSFEYNPTCDTRPEAQKRLQEIVNQIEDHMNRLDAEAEAHGLRKTRGITSNERFRWLVEFQINEKRHYGIWQDFAHHLTRGAVFTGIQKTAELIDLTLRPSDPPSRQPQKQTPSVTQ
jgi:hypothetical protein